MKRIMLLSLLVSHRTRKQWTSKAALLGTLVFLLSIGAQAQEASSIKNTQAVGAASGESDAPKEDIYYPRTITDEKETQPRHNPLTRFAWGFQYKYELAEQSRSVLAVVPGTTSAIVIQNPEHYLQKHSLTFKFSDTLLCGSIGCLPHDGKWWQRALLGLSVTGSLTERQAVQQGFLITQQTFTKHYQLGADIIFEPKKLAQQWKPWATLIPKIEFKRDSNFDFVKSGGTLIAAPFPESALNTWTFTWDLTHLIPETKTPGKTPAKTSAKQERVIASETQQQLVSYAIQQQGAKLCVTILGTSKSYISVPLTFSAESCHELAKNIEADEYELACQLRDPVLGDRVQSGPRIKATEPSEDTKKPNPNSCKW